MDQKRIEEIRGRHEAAKRALVWKDVSEVDLALGDIPVLLAALDIAESDIVMARHHVELVSADRDRLAARVEALERALSEYCCYCKCLGAHHKEPPCSICSNLGKDGKNHFQFDEQRFAGGEQE